MLFSLIVGTYGRKEELAKFLYSLKFQECKDFEVIIVDQNEKDLLKDIISEYESEFSIIHCFSEKGFSKSKNIGVKYATGTIIAFPDDDCWYMPDTLSKVSAHFNANPSLMGVCGRTVDVHGQTSLNKFSNKQENVGKGNAWHLVGSQTVFFKTTLDMIIGRHDENLGVGANTIWQSCEDIDYVLRGVEVGAEIAYFPDITIGHNQVDKLEHEVLIARIKKYTPGTGYVMRKHKYPLSFMIKRIYRPFFGSILFRLMGKSERSSYYEEIWKGILKGWRSYM